MASLKVFLFLAVAAIIFVVKVDAECKECCEEDAQALTAALTDCASSGRCTGCLDETPDCNACKQEKIAEHTTTNMDCWNTEYADKGYNDKQRGDDYGKKVQNNVCRPIIIDCCFHGTCKKQ
ncbi:hypothetical protein CHUAL_006310 [Chamberlinius hualienensis]